MKEKRTQRREDVGSGKRSVNSNFFKFLGEVAV